MVARWRRLAYHTLDAGDPIFVANGDGSNPRQIFRDSADKHNHYLAWGPDGNWIYYVHGTPATNEMDLWRISRSGGDPERLTEQDTDMRDPTPLGRETVLYLASENDGSGPWIWAFDIPQGVPPDPFGLEQYTSLSASADGKRLAVTVANPKVRLWTVPIRAPWRKADVKAFPIHQGASLDAAFSRKHALLFVLPGRKTACGGLKKARPPKSGTDRRAGYWSPLQSRRTGAGSRLSLARRVNGGCN